LNEKQNLSALAWHFPLSFLKTHPSFFGISPCGKSKARQFTARRPRFLAIPPLEVALGFIR